MSESWRFVQSARPAVIPVQAGIHEGKSGWGRGTAGVGSRVRGNDEKGGGGVGAPRSNSVARGLATVGGVGVEPRTRVHHVLTDRGGEGVQAVVAGLVAQFVQ